MKFARYVSIIVLLVLGLVACSSAPAAQEPAATSGSTDVESTSPETPEGEVDEGESTTAPTEEAAAGESSEPSGERKVLRIGSGRDILTLDPAQMVQVPDWPIATAIYSSLVKYKPGLTAEVEPDLAERWEISEDGTVYTFYLRQGVQWQNGYGEVTAHDVKYTYDRLKDPEVGSAYATDLAQLNSVEVVDDYTVTFTFDAPYAAFLSAVAAFRPGRIVNQQAIEELGADYTPNAVGSGPYMLERWTPDSEIVLVKNPDYWDADNYAIDEIVYTIIPEASVRTLALQSGDVDLIHPDDPEGIEALAQADGITLLEEAGTNIIKFYFNTQQPPFDQLEVRQAIAHAIDRAAIAKFALNGIAVPALSEIPPFMFGYTEDVPGYEYDPERARELLAEAGYADGLDLNLIVWDFGTYPRAAEALPAMLQDVGINLSIEVLEGGLIQTRFAEGTYDAALFGIGRVDPHQVLYAGYLSTSIPPEGQNRARYQNPELDALLIEQAEAVDPDQRRAALEEAQRIITEDAVDVPLYVEKIYVAFRDNVEGALPASQFLLAWEDLDINP